jgi:hypothetical protein
MLRSIMGFVRRHKKVSATILIVVAVTATLVVRFVASFLPVPLVISKETTYITEPLCSDGTPDYCAALNQRLSKGVTPENNAAVLFWKAAGPGVINAQDRQRYFNMLGVPVPQENGGCFVRFDKWLDGYKQEDAHVPDKASAALDVAMKRPWSKREFPILAKWIAANERAMVLVVAGAKRRRRYDPLILDGGEGESLLKACLWDTQQCRDFARCLVARAMFRVKEGDLDEAWDDLLACHRLARLTGEGWCLVEAQVAIAIDGMASIGDHVLLQHAKFTAPRIAKMRASLAELPPMPRTADLMDQSERFMMLDFALSVKRGIAADCPDIEKLGLSFTWVADWNIVLRTINSWHDRFVAAVRKPTRAERQKAIEEATRDLKREGTDAQSRKSPPSLVGKRREAASWQVGMILVSLLMPDEGGLSSAEDRSAMQFELTKLAFALAEYHAVHGRYPAELADLVPKYVKTVSKDIFAADADLHYIVQGDGYLLYSVGVNGKDDGGKQQDDAKNGESWDDLAVRMTAGKL